MTDSAPQLDPIARQKRERRLAAWFLLGAVVAFALVQALARIPVFAPEGGAPATVEPSE